MRREPVYVLLLVFLLIRSDAVKGFEDGSPAWMCPVGFPRHGNSEVQTSTPPATITLSASSYNPGDTITVTLSGDIEGFQIRAHRAPGANDTEEIVGEFTSWPAGTKPLAWMPQTGVTYNCITHADDDDLNNLVFSWQAPSTSVGDVIFKATIVQDFDVFWDNVLSPVLTANTAATATEYLSTVNTDFTDYGFADSCGTTKGCLMYPSGCRAADCEVVVAFAPLNNGASLRFEMSAVLDTGYLALGFSSDRDMGEELTVNCMRSGDTLYVEHAYDRPDYNIRQRITDLTDISIQSNNGRLYCSFTRDTTLTYIVGGTTTSRTSDLNNKVYLFAAVGDVYNDRGVIKKHTILPIISSKTISVFETKITTGNSVPATLGVHVTFGVIGYFLLAGFAMLVGRHFRREMKSPACGERLWFQMHRGTMISVLILGIISIIMAIITIKGWNLNVIATVHGIVGIVTTALMATNIIMGIFRPVKGKARQIFAVAHRICGVLTYVFTIVCLLLGANVDLLHADVRVGSAVVIAVGFIIQIVLEVVLEVLRKKPAKAEAADSSPDKQKDNKHRLEAIKISLIGIYGFTTLAITIAVMYLVFAY